MAHFKKDAVKLYFEIRGQGEPLLIIAGGGADSRFYSGLANILEKDFQVVLMDPRGCGRSERGDQEYSFDLLVSDIIALLDHLNIDAVNVLGHSMGGITAQHFAYKHPAYIKKLILWATDSSLSAFGKHCCKTAGLIKAEGSLESFVNVIAIWNFSDEFFKKESNFDEFLSGARQDPYPLSTEVFKEQMNIINTFNCSDQLNNIKAPTLVIGCEKDIIFPSENAKNLSMLISNAKYQEIPKATHSVHIEQPESVAKIITSYILT